jgi:hypothetical protein
MECLRVHGDDPPKAVGIGISDVIKKWWWLLREVGRWKFLFIIFNQVEERDGAIPCILQSTGQWM